MKKGLLGFMMLLAVIGLIGCTAGKNVKKESPAKAPAAEEQVVPLDKKYSTLIVFPYETTPVLQKDYPIELKASRDALITSLEAAGVYSKVLSANTVENHSEPAALLIKTKVADMRIASTSARFWGGAFAGNSYMHLNMLFVDAASGKLLHEKFFSSTNNAMAAAWTFGANDRSLPEDLAKIAAEYVLKKVQAK